MNRHTIIWETYLPVRADYIIAGAEEDGYPTIA